ncbi:MAG: hypothetical protein JO167_13640 [Alphaproteobacteria bacterium]|nr:hypothetical protein [Alphaproteobacteria bacterium]
MLGAAFAANARTGVNFWGTQRGEVHMRALLNAHLAEPELIGLIEEGKRLSPDELFDLAMTRKGDGR